MAKFHALWPTKTHHDEENKPAVFVKSIQKMICGSANVIWARIWASWTRFEKKIFSLLYSDQNKYLYKWNRIRQFAWHLSAERIALQTESVRSMLFCYLIYEWSGVTIVGQLFSSVCLIIRFITQYKACSLKKHCTFN